MWKVRCIFAFLWIVFFVGLVYLFEVRYGKLWPAYAVSGKEGVANVHTVR